MSKGHDHCSKCGHYSHIAPVCDVSECGCQTPERCGCPSARAHPTPVEKRRAR